MKMIYKILTMLVLFTSLTAHADISSSTVANAGWDKLSAAQQADILSKITTSADQNTQTTNELTNPAKIDEWVTLGEHIGQALGGAAKEVGMITNDFVKSPIGTLTIALIVWHFIGSVIIHMVGGGMVFLMGMGLIFWHSRSTKTSTDPDIVNGWATAYYIMGFVTILLSIATMFMFDK